MPVYRDTRKGYNARMTAIGDAQAVYLSEGPALTAELLRIVNIETSRRNGPVTGSFPVAERDEIMLVTDGGQLIRMPVNDIRIAGRATQGVTLFRVSEGEKVVSVTKLGDEEDDDNGADADG